MGHQDFYSSVSTCLQSTWSRWPALLSIEMSSNDTASSKQAVWSKKYWKTVALLSGHFYMFCIHGISPVLLPHTAVIRGHSMPTSILYSRSILSYGTFKDDASKHAGLESCHMSFEVLFQTFFFIYVSSHSRLKKRTMAFRYCRHYCRMVGCTESFSHVFAPYILAKPHLSPFTIVGIV